MAKVLPRSLAQNAFLNTGVSEWRDEHLINHYNGRSMGRERCFALVGDLPLLAKFLVAMAELEVLAEPENGEAKWATTLADNMANDAMGYDKVFYFPGITLSES